MKPSLRETLKIKIMDWYLLRSFMAPFGVCVAIFCILVMIGRFFEKMSIFNTYRAHAGDILAYIVLGLPYWLSLVLPVATMLALLFSLGHLQHLGEITAFRSAGIPSWRIFAPYAAIGVFLSLLTLWGGLTFLPALNFQSRTVYRVTIKKRELFQYRKDNVVAAGQHHRRFTIGWLDVEKDQMKDVVIDRFSDDLKWLDTVSAKKATYTKGRWFLEKGLIRTPDPADPANIQEKLFNTYWLDVPEKPADFVIEDKVADDMTARELVERAQRLRRLGAPAHKEEVALHLRIALPFANLIVIALAIPFALRSGQHGRIQNFSYALGLSFLYWGVTSVCQSFGEQGHLPAWLAAWMSNFIFSGVAAWRLVHHT